MNRIVIIIFLFLIFFSFTLSIYVHPGRTSSDGCHYCWTNCVRWGYTYGTRHTHYGSSCSCNPPIDPLYCQPSTPTSTPYIPPPTSTPIPTAITTSASTPTFTPPPTKTPTPIPTNTPSPTPKTGVLGETTTKPTSPLETLIGLGILGGMGYGGYRLIKKFISMFRATGK